MNDFPVIISFYSSETPYQVEVQNLIASCKKFGLKTSIEGVPSFGSWELNCAYKPFFILKKLEELKTPVLWVDADGVFVQAPKREKVFTSDLSVRYERTLPDDHPSKVISSTVFVNCTEKGEDLVKFWAKECEKSLLNSNRSGEFWDQVALRDAILANPMKASVEILPLSYAKIFDHQGDLKDVVNPVIEHYQASRRYKQIIGG